MAPKNPSTTDFQEYDMTILNTDPDSASASQAEINTEIAAIGEIEASAQGGPASRKPSPG